MKKDIEKYINDNIKAQTPPSLSKENIVKMLEDSEQAPKLTKRKRQQTVYKFVAVAAAIAIVLSGTFIYRQQTAQKTPPSVNNGTVSVSADDNYDEIYSRLKAMKNEIAKEKARSFFDSFGAKDSAENVVDMNGNANVGPAPGDTADLGVDEKTKSEKAFGTTNTQEAKIDEGDIIKTDGKNIYLADRENKCVYIVKADSGKMQKLSEISFSGNVHIQEMYLTGNRLAVIYSEYDYSKQPTSYNDTVTYDAVFRGGCCASWVCSDTKIGFYDVSNPENATLISNFSQSGDFTSSRLRDGKIYLVSSYAVDLFARDYKDKCIPETAKNDVKELIPASKITLVNGTDTPAYAVISTFDVQKAEKTDSSAIFGNPTNVYVTADSFYIAEEKYDSEKCNSYLNILKFAFTENGVNYLASAKADGRLNDNLSMSEYGGYFRIATTCTETEQKGSGKDAIMTYLGETNKLYVFDSEMNQTGIIDDFAKDEQIRSARYIGNYAYVVTFRQTDPLFVINLSDPKNPKIEGEIKLPGFSSYLHPVSKGLLVGIGYDGDEKGTNGNMKVSLFSVADPKNPKEMSSVKVGNENNYVSSDLSYSYKSFVNLPNGEFAVPFSVEDYTKTYNRTYGYVYGMEQVFVRYGIIDGAVTEIARYEVGNDTTTIQGGTYIGNYFYAFSSDFIDGNKSADITWKAKLTSFDMTANTTVSEIEL